MHSYHGLYLCMNQIVSLGMPGVSPTERVGTYVSPRDWNALISDPDTVSDRNLVAVVFPVHHLWLKELVESQINVFFF